jgi:tRNA-2-methylthio-N6-dimethylallyladenosine synthase
VKKTVPDTRSQVLKKFFIKTWGCQMNVYDSARMADVVAGLGYALTDNPADADLVIFNTCHIREKATEKLFSELGRLHEHKAARAGKGRDMLIAVGGCVAQAEGEEIQRRAPYVDMVFGPQTYHQLPVMIAQVLRRQGKVLNIEFPPEPKFDYLPVAQTDPGVSAFLSIQEGCDRFCSYCVVPYTRGAEYSRPMAAVIAEAEALAGKGVKEITLLGQNVNAWHDGEGGLGALLRRLAEIPGLKRLRYMTSHPLDMSDDLIAAHRGVPQVMPFLHLPIQSGSDRILEAMNRKHTADEYLCVVEKLRQARPDIALSSDFIVGFPGETDRDFEATLRLVREVKFAQAFSFAYSRRPGTPAAAMEGQIARGIARERLKELQALLFEQQGMFNGDCVGKALPVLFENASLRDGYLFGRTPYLQAVLVRAPVGLVGEEVEVRLTGAGKNSLKGEMEASQT